MQTRARNLFGENINLTDRSPLGIFIQVLAWSIALLWQLAEKVYYSAFVDTSEGNSLDYAVRKGGVTRRGAEKAIATQRFTGDNGTVIPLGFLVGTETEILFETIESGEITTGTLDLTVRALIGGTQSNIPAGNINQIINPLAGLSSTVNTTDAGGGRNIETDAELRTRYFLSFASAGASTIDALIAALLRTVGVRGANIEEVKNLDNDVIGFRAIVLGGLANDVAQTILNYKAWGVKTFGTQTGTAVASNGQNYTINFDYATEVDLYANITITKSGAFPVNGVDLIKDKIAEYIGGTDTQGNIYSGLAMGQDIVYARLIDVIFNVAGVADVVLDISKDNITFAKSNIAVDFDEVAQTDPSKLVISVV
ncbi:MAG: baseplate J/gp47 family protein [Chitinophagales bacterium]|nr:baseplate J/gp47 family protein [Chitinophagales bacterium]